MAGLGEMYRIAMDLEDRKAQSNQHRPSALVAGGAGAFLGGVGSEMERQQKLTADKPARDLKLLQIIEKQAEIEQAEKDEQRREEQQTELRSILYKQSGDKGKGTTAESKTNAFIDDDGKIDKIIMKDGNLSFERKEKDKSTSASADLSRERFNYQKDQDLKTEAYRVVASEWHDDKRKEGLEEDDLARTGKLPKKYYPRMKEVYEQMKAGTWKPDKKKVGDSGKYDNLFDGL